MALFLTGFAFYVKAYVAIISGTFLFSFLIYQGLRSKEIRKSLIDALVLCGIIFGFWLLMFGSPKGLFRFFWGMLHLAQDNSSAAAYYPQNNWFYLSLSLLGIVLLFIINKNLKARFFFILVGLSLFASWKHGMAREDFFHVKGLLTYLMICLFSFLLFVRKKNVLNGMLVLITLGCFALNIPNSMNYQKPKIELFSARNFIAFISDFEELKRQADKNSYQQSASNLMPQEMLDSIGGSTVDIYPWDYSIAAVNKLNWKPRVVIQSYAAYTSWLDKQNAKHFSGKAAPEYLVWEKKKITQDHNKNDYNSLDNRYLLNDEPQTILQIISQYKLVSSNKKFALYQLRNKPIEFQVKPLLKTESSWGEWIKVPSLSSGKDLVRVKLRFKKTFMQKAKSFLYKDEQVWIYLQLSNGSLHKFRIVPKNAVDGVWINPYLYSNAEWFTIEKVMFAASNQKILSKQIELEWETVKFNRQNVLSNFFDMKTKPSYASLFQSQNSFDKKTNTNWGTLLPNQISEEALSPPNSHLFNETYSSTFKLNLDSIPFGPIRIHSNVWLKARNYKMTNNVWLVISIKDKERGILYEQLSIDEQLFERSNWNNISKVIEYSHHKSNCELGIYIWNKSNTELLLDDFRIVISPVNI